MSMQWYTLLILALCGKSRQEGPRCSESRQPNVISMPPWKPPYLRTQFVWCYPLVSTWTGTHVAYQHTHIPVCAHTHRSTHMYITTEKVAQDLHFWFQFKTAFKYIKLFLSLLIKCLVTLTVERESDMVSALKKRCPGETSTKWMCIILQGAAYPRTHSRLRKKRARI